MAVTVADVEQGSPAQKCGISAGDTLLSLNGHTVMDVLDYRFYQNAEKVVVEFIGKNGKIKKAKVKKQEYDELGMLFNSYLMDKQRACKNKCVFCFIDQLPKGLRDSLYFKDDDSRLSFLFGNYITLTNITEHEIERIINMHISPINISVHTTNPELRVKMMANPNAGKVLSHIWRFNEAGIKMKCQLVLCPDYNDGKELERTLTDLNELENVESVAVVPVGLTKHREGLAELKPFDKQSAAEVIDTIDRFGDASYQKYGERRFYASDEFYLLSERQIPAADYYGDFLQLENGVGMWSLFLSEANDALEDIDCDNKKRHIAVATGVSAYSLIRKVADLCENKCNGLTCDVYAIKNNFFGEKITVAGLVTATDIYDQLKDKDLGQTLYIPSSMLRSEGDMFLDSITVEELSEKLGVDVVPTDCDGYAFVSAILE